jgi:anti-anti-sigma regulatory factor
MTQPLTYQIDRRLPIAVIRLRGELTSLSSAVARGGLYEALLAEPTSVVVDLSGVTAADDVALTLFPAVANVAAQWPGAPLLLCAASPPIAGALDRMGITADRIATYPTVRAALDVAATDPVPLRVHQRLEPTVDAPRIARELTFHTCWGWGLPDLATPAKIVSSELVTNAVRHAGTVIDLTLALRDGQLRVSVRDGTQQLVRMQTPAESDDHGRGLLIVDSIATAWGNVPIADGKAVWATLRVSSRRVRSVGHLVGTA